MRFRKGGILRRRLLPKHLRRAQHLRLCFRKGGSQFRRFHRRGHQRRQDPLEWGPATPTVSDERERPRIDDLKTIEIKRIWETHEADRPKTEWYKPKRMRCEEAEPCENYDPNVPKPDKLWPEGAPAGVRLVLLGGIPGSGTRSIASNIRVWLETLL